MAALGRDAPGVRPDLRVAVGDRVRAGQALLVDRRRPEVCVTAPGAGMVTAIERGPRRRLESVVIALEDDRAVEFEVPGAGRLPSRERIETLLLASGLWAALRTRPFSRIPDPRTHPRAVFVTALESDPLAPDAARLIGLAGEDFARGVAALAALTDGPVWVCARPGAGLPLPDAERVRLVEVEGPHPAGLPGTHVHWLDPVGPGRTVWTVAWPAVAAIGTLLATGRLPVARVVALTGPAMTRPRLVRTRAGASTEELVAGGLAPGPCRVVSGSVLSGHAAHGPLAFLGRADTQVCALAEDPRPAPGWTAPARGGRARRVMDLLRGTAPWTTSLGGMRDAFFPLERTERVVPLDLPLGPLLRALVVGDPDAARQLGALELAEEDLALASYLSVGKLELGALLRGVLDELEKEAE